MTTKKTDARMTVQAAAHISTEASARDVALAEDAHTEALAAPTVEARSPGMKKLTIHHVSRIEGHAKITIKLDDAGKVTDTQFHVTQIRGFEKFTEGRPYYEMPAITSRICGICPVSHELASSKACDSIMAVRIPETAARLRELLHMAQFVQSHALSFFHLSAPDLLLGMDSDPVKRNVAGSARSQSGRSTRRHRPPQVRPDCHRAVGQRARSPVLVGARRGQRSAGSRRS